jgi:hypothetical protein
MNEWFQKKQNLQRQFTIMANQVTEVQMLNLNDLHRMEIEFFDYYSDLLKNELHILKKALNLKLVAINVCSM